MNKNICKTCDNLASFGFRVIVPDVYRGKSPVNREEAGHCKKNLDWDGAIENIKACKDHLKSLGCEKIGVLGFCMGGGVALAALCEI